MIDLGVVVQVIQAVSLIFSVLWAAAKVVNKVGNLETSFNELSKYVKENMDLRLDEHDKRIAIVEVAVEENKPLRRLRRK